ncbi:hypothetical protein [Nostoc sp. UHCC 0926]
MGDIRLNERAMSILIYNDLLSPCSGDALYFLFKVSVFTLIYPPC